MSEQRKFRKTIVNWLESNEIMFYGLSVILLLIAVPLSLMFFPDDTMATFIMVSISGLISSVGALASALVSQDDKKESENRSD